MLVKITIAGTPERNETQVADGVRVEQVLWRNNSNVEVELVAIHGGGHGIPQPYRRHPRGLGPSPREPNGPGVIWAFFDRQDELDRVQGHGLGARVIRIVFPVEAYAAHRSPQPQNEARC
jgi:hypothetical protein